MTILDEQYMHIGVWHKNLTVFLIKMIIKIPYQIKKIKS